MIQYFPIVTGSLTVLGNINVSGSITTSGSITISGSITSASFATSASNATNAISASYANNLTVAGTLTAQTLVVQTITSSVDFVTGSTRFGSLSSNTHQFTGSVNVSGSITSQGGIILGNSSAISPTGSIGYNNAIGVFIYGKSGSEADFRLYNRDGLTAMSVIAGTQNINFNGSATFGSDVFTYANGGIFFSGGGVYTSGIFQNASGLQLQSGGSPRLTISSTGAATFTNKVTSTGFKSSSGNTGSTNAGTAYGIINVTTKGIYYIFAQLVAGIGDINYTATAIVVADGSVARIAFSNNATTVISLSGTLVSVTQNSGATQGSGIDWTFIAQN